MTQHAIFRDKPFPPRDRTTLKSFTSTNEMWATYLLLAVVYLCPVSKRMLA